MVINPVGGGQVGPKKSAPRHRDWLRDRLVSSVLKRYGFRDHGAAGERRTMETMAIGRHTWENCEQTGKECHVYGSTIIRIMSLVVNQSVYLFVMLLMIVVS